MFGSTLVVKIKKTQESTPRFLKRITEVKENIILLPVDSPLVQPVVSISLCSSIKFTKSNGSRDLATCSDARAPFGNHAGADYVSLSWG